MAPVHLSKLQLDRAIILALTRIFALLSLGIKYARKKEGVASRSTFDRARNRCRLDAPLITERSEEALLKPKG